ncbi:MAG: DUF4159 domain-containing protein [Planctomycetes bacterium]|nr:DUF4159 domain-containing protein [Planctomycetota bacterium]
MGIGQARYGGFAAPNPLGPAAAACLLAALLAGAGACAPRAAAADLEPENNGVSAGDVQRAIENGKKQLLSNIRTYSSSTQYAGYRLLAILALLNAGAKPDDQTMRTYLQIISADASINDAMRQSYSGCYNAGVYLMIFAAVGDEKYRGKAGDLALKLQRLQAPNGGWGDYSRTQFALLGLKSAEDLGVKVPDDVFTRAKRFLEAGQNADGGWGYKPGVQPSTGSMTAAGITGLCICGARLYRGTSVCGAGSSDVRMARAMDWLGRNFSVVRNPGSGSWNYYYLYALERIGVLMALQRIGGHDWYKEGAEAVVRSQTAPGLWAGDMCATEFSVLFLAKGSQPVAVQKLKYPGDWNPDPYDVKNLVEQTAKDLETPMTFQVVETSAGPEDLAAAPVLYLQGREGFQFTAKFREAVRLFVDQGGFVVASNCCGSGAFDRAFREEMLRIFPDSQFEVLPADHPIYSARHRIVQKEAFMIEGLNAGCRTSVFYAPHDVCCGWGGCEGCKDHGGPRADEGLRLGVNLVAYAVGFQKLRDKLDAVKIAKQPNPDEVGRGALVIGQLFHNGEWNPDPASIPNLARTLREQAGMKAEVAKRRVTLGVDDPGDYPLLYLTGHKRFAFDDRQIEILRKYLDNGGFLLCDPCCGKPEFDASFRELCAKLYHDTKLERLPADHAVFQAPLKLAQVKYKLWAKRMFPDLDDKPYLEGLTRQSRLRVLYSRFNFGCELQGHRCATCIGLEGPSAYAVAVNAVLFALSQ